MSDTASDILALVEDGPKSAKQLAIWLKLPWQIVRDECRELRARRQLEQLRDYTWAPPNRSTAVGRPSLFASALPDRMCTRCHERYVQEHGLCRTCGRETGVVMPTTFELDAARMQRRHAREGQPIPAPPDPIRDGGIRTIVVDGIEYDALSVGSAPVTGDYKTGSPLNRLHSIDK